MLFIYVVTLKYLVQYTLDTFLHFINKSLGRNSNIFGWQIKYKKHTSNCSVLSFFPCYLSFLLFPEAFSSWILE